MRLGAYGDPAAVPVAVWRSMLARARGWPTDPGRVSRTSPRSRIQSTSRSTTARDFDPSRSNGRPSESLREHFGNASKAFCELNSALGALCSPVFTAAPSRSHAHLVSYSPARRSRSITRATRHDANDPSPPVTRPHPLSPTTMRSSRNQGLGVRPDYDNCDFCTSRSCRSQGKSSMISYCDHYDFAPVAIVVVGKRWTPIATLAGYDCSFRRFC